MPTFRKDIHLGHEVPLIDSSDIKDKAILGRHIMDRVIDWFHIIAKAIRNEHIDDGAVDTRTLANGAVTSSKIADNAIKSNHIADGEVKTNDIADKSITADKLDPSLLNEIRSAGQHGYHLATQFGDSDLIGISQKALTIAFDKVWQKIEDITGEACRGISMLVSPTYFYGNEGCILNVSANSNSASGIFESIRFYWNDEDEEETPEHTTAFLADANVERVEPVSVILPLDKLIDNRVKVKCKAKIMGVTYTREQMIVNYDAFWIGGGTPQSAMADVNRVVFDKYMRAAKDVTLAQGQHIVIVMGEYMRGDFIRADINGVEIEFEEDRTTMPGYVVLTSANTYQAGTINVDING